MISLHTSTLCIETAENWYSHIPKAVCEHKDITALWNQGVQTDGEILNNRPDVMVKNAWDMNVVQKKAENIKI